MAEERIRFGDLSPRKIAIAAGIILGIIALFSSFYKVDAGENAVILRLGAYSHSSMPGLQMKIPFGIDKVYKVKVDYIHKLEFGFRTVEPGKRTTYSKQGFEDESWMLTGDLNIADAMWVVQYRIIDPVAYLFNVREVENTIRDVSEAAMRLMIGDRSFQEVLQVERMNISELVWKRMQEVLNSYHAGISIKLVQLQDVFPPDPVADSFNEVNRAKQEQEESINKARQAYNKEIFRAQGDAERLIAEAEGYAIERTNRAKGDVELFNSVLLEYRKAPQVTRDRLFLETMEEIYTKTPHKVIVDKRLKNVLPLLEMKAK